VSSDVPSILFYILAALAVAGALGMVANVRNSVAAAMSLVVTMVALAGIYVVGGASALPPVVRTLRDRFGRGGAGCIDGRRRGEPRHPAAQRRPTADSEL